MPISSNAVNFEIYSGHVLTLDLFQVMEAADSQFPREHRALVDNGSQATTTNKRFLLNNYTSINIPRVLRDAGGKIAYKVEGQGTLMVPRSDGSFTDIKCWYTPTLPVTVISPEEHVQQNLITISFHTIFSH